MAKKSNNPRKINALSPKHVLKRHVLKKDVALRLKNYLLIILFIQAFLLITVLFFVSFVLRDKELIYKDRSAQFTYWYQIASKYPNRPDVLFNLAKSAYESGRIETARNSLEKAIEIDPLFDDAKKLLDEVD